MRDTRRLMKELEDLQKKDPDGDQQVSAHQIGDDYRTWTGCIKGPVGTPYEGGYFELSIQIPSEYPYIPPKMKFVTRIWHPNISSQTGAICLDILKDEWSPALTIRTAMLSIQALLSAPEPDDPQDAEVASMYKRNYAEFANVAKMWTAEFARDPAEVRASKVALLVGMGFDESRAQAALARHNFDQSLAVNELLGDE